MAETRREFTVVEVMHAVEEKCEAHREAAVECNYTIFRVPAHICRVRQDLFRPHIVSIGPYHHGRKDLSKMEHIKWQFLRELIREKSTMHYNFLQACIERLKDLEGAARACYFDEVRLINQQKFVEMLLLDGCFIIQFLIKWKTDELGDACGKSWWNEDMIMHDLFLLENQIPLFVLQELFALISPYSTNFNSSLEQIAFDFLMKDEPMSLPPSTPYGIHHFLHLFHRCYTNTTNNPDHPQGSHPPSGNGNPIQTIPSASRLVEAGVTFRKKKSPSSIFDINFRKGVLEIPSVEIHEKIIYRLANLVALEQCVADVGSVITSYAIFMDCLIDTAEDVTVLQRRGILGKMMASNKEVAGFFNQLCGYSVMNFKNHYLAMVFQEVDTYCRSNWHEHRASLMRDYFSNPWASISFIAAAVLLVLTFLQTFMAFYSYFHAKRS